MKHVILPVGHNFIIELNNYFSSMLPKPYKAQITPTSCLTPDIYEIGLCDHECSYHMPSAANKKGYIAPEITVTKFTTENGEFMKVDLFNTSPRYLRRMLKDMLRDQTVMRFYYSDWMEYSIDSDLENIAALDSACYEEMRHLPISGVDSPKDIKDLFTRIQKHVKGLNLTLLLPDSRQVGLDSGCKLADSRDDRSIIADVADLDKDASIGDKIVFGHRMKPVPPLGRAHLYGAYDIFTLPNLAGEVDPAENVDFLSQLQLQRKFESSIPTDVNGNMADLLIESPSLSGSFRFTPEMIFEEACRDLKKLTEDYVVTDLKGCRFRHWEIANLVTDKNDILNFQIPSHGITITVGFDEVIGPRVIHYKPAKSEIDELSRYNLPESALVDKKPFAEDQMSDNEIQKYSTEMLDGLSKHGQPLSFPISSKCERLDPVHTWTERVAPVHHLIGVAVEVIESQLEGGRTLEEQLVDKVRGASSKMLQDTNFEKAAAFNNQPIYPMMFNPDGSVMTAEQVVELMAKVRDLSKPLNFISKDDLPIKLIIRDECHEENSPMFSIDGNYTMDELRESCNLGKVYRLNGVKINSAEIFNEVFIGDALTVNDAHKGVKASLSKDPKTGEVTIVKVARFDNGL